MLGDGDGSCTGLTPADSVKVPSKAYTRQPGYIALFFEAVRKSTDLADGLTRGFEESKGVLSGRDANSS